jgi:hypothetical protein
MSLFNKLCYGAAGGMILAVGVSLQSPKPIPQTVYEEGDDFEMPSSGGGGDNPSAGNGTTGNGTTGNGTTGNGTTGNGTLTPAGNGTFSSADAQAWAAAHGQPGMCAYAVARIALAQGLGNFSGHAYTYEKQMEAQGWVRLEGYTAHNAPEGAMLLYSNDMQQGRPPRNGGGGTYGHVEYVTYTANGEKRFTSSGNYRNPGGSVPDNFIGVWVHKSALK